LDLEQYEKLGEPLREVTLCFLVREGEILLAMKKKGFGVPLKWLMGPRAGFAREIIAGAPRGLFDERGLKWLFEADPQSNDHGIVLWYALSLASWAQRQSAVPW